MKTKEKKTVGLLALLMALCMPLMISCDSEGNDVSMAWSRSSGCKSEPKSVKNPRRVALPWGDEKIEYENLGNGQLYLKHVNALFNCETDEVNVTVFVDNHIISIVEQGNGNSHNCVCPFDVECLLKDLSFGQYQVRICLIDTSNLLHEFQIDYTATTNKGTVILKNNTD